MALGRQEWHQGHSIAGRSVPCEGEVGYDKAKKKLESIIMGREVELRNEKKVDYDCLICDVYVDGKSVAESLS